MKELAWVLLWESVVHQTGKSKVCYSVMGMYPTLCALWVKINSEGDSGNGTKRIIIKTSITLKQSNCNYENAEF